MYRTSLGAASCLAVLALAVRGESHSETGADQVELYQPPILESADGVLDVTLAVEPDCSSLGDTRISACYNGQPMGPTIKVKPGDVLTITLDNNLAPSSEEEKAMMTTVKDPKADTAEVTKLYNRLQDDGSVYGTVATFIVPPPQPSSETCSGSKRIFGLRSCVIVC